MAMETPTVSTAGLSKVANCQSRGTGNLWRERPGKSPQPLCVMPRTQRLPIYEVATYGAHSKGVRRRPCGHERLSDAFSARREETLEEQEKGLTRAQKCVILLTMKRKVPESRPTMTELLRQALAESESLRAVERATGVKRQSMMKFLRREQSLRLDKADILAEYFGIDVKRKGK